MSTEQMIFLIPIISVVLGLSVAAVAVITEHQRKVNQAQQRHAERMAAIEKGLELPPDPVEAPRHTPRQRYLLSGLVWLGAGLAAALAAGPLVGAAVARLGWVAAAVGVAFLIFYAVEGRRKPEPPGTLPWQDSNRGP
jgi:hypothetical protein